MRARRRSVALVTALLALVGLAACGQKTVNTDQAEATIASEFKQQGIPLTKVSCPGDIEAKVGTRVSCTALNPAETELKLEGKVTEVNGDKARFQVKAVSGTAKGTVIAAEARQLIEQKVGEKAEAFTCPAKVPIPTRPSVTCALTVPGGRVFDAKVTVSKDSNVSVQVAPQPRAGG